MYITKMLGKLKKIYNKIMYKKNLYVHKYVNRDKCIPKRAVYSKREIKEKFEGIHKYYPEESLKKAVKRESGKTKKAGVVFNSGKVTKKENGKSIDNEDVVVRVNFMPTKGYEKKVGSKTTMRVLGREWIFSEGENILIHTYNNNDYLKSDIKNMKKSERLREKKLYICRNDYVNQFFWPYLGGMMTNGFRAVMISLSVCDHVTIYGADPKGASSADEDGSIKKFPTEKDEKYIRKKSEEWNLEQNIERYFEPIEDGSQSDKLHPTLSNEYEFYRSHPRVSMNNVSGQKRE